MIQRYDPEKLMDGYNTVDGEEVFFISNPAVGLWAYRGRFEETESTAYASAQRAR
jgi:hypothetical protein